MPMVLQMLAPLLMRFQSPADYHEMLLSKTRTPPAFTPYSYDTAALPVAPAEPPPATARVFLVECEL